MKHSLLLCLFISVCGVLTAQQTAEEFGKTIFESFKNKDTNSFDQWIPDFEENMKIAASMGFELTEEEKAEFRKRYPAYQADLKLRLTEVIAEGEEIGLKWSEATLDSVNVNETIIPLKGEQDGETVTTTLVAIFFQQDGNGYFVAMNMLFPFEERWKFGGNSIVFGVI